MGHAAEPNPQLDTTVLETWRAVTIRCGYDPEGTEACGATLRPPPAHHAPASAPAPAPPPDPNSVASSDAFVYTNPLGEGGMARVVTALQHSLGREVAIKVIKGAAGPAEIARFENEARITALLDHPHIVPIYTLGQGPDGMPFLAMKRIEGESWEEVLRREPLDGTRARLQRHLDVFEKLVDAIAYAHERGVVHRDLKPANVMVGAFGEVYLVDWGLALHTDEVKTDANLAGTPAYMAPEQAGGEPVTPATDVYALGAILYRLFVDRPPHQGESVVNVIYAALRNEVLPIAPTHPAPPALVQLAERCLATAPADRFANGQALRPALHSVLTGESDRVESDRLVAEAEDLVARWGGEFQVLLRAEWTLQSALQRWPENEAAHALLGQTASTLVEAAIEGGDLALAKLYLERVPPQDQQALAAAIKRRRLRDLPEAVLAREGFRREVRAWGAGGAVFAAAVGCLVLTGRNALSLSFALHKGILLTTVTLFALMFAAFMAAERMDHRRGWQIRTVLGSSFCASIGWVVLGAILALRDTSDLGGRLVVFGFFFFFACVSGWVFKHAREHRVLFVED